VQPTTFEIAPPRGITVTLEAPPYVKVDGRFYQFAYWGGGVQQVTQPKATYNTANGNVIIAAYYQTTSAVFEGTLDVADGQQIAGWVWDRSQPNSPLSVDVYDGSAKLATVPANLFRQDLLNFGVGNGNHAFSLPTPASLKDGKTHAIYARVAGTQIELGNSPKSLTVVLPPAISGQPVSLAVCQGQPASFSVAATGMGLAYQWLKNGAPLTGANGSQLNVSAAGAGDVANYSVVVSNAAGSATSSPAKLTVNAPVAITKQPVNVVACQGQSVTFSASATGDGVRYQWRKNGGNIAGATGSSFTIPAVGTGDVGSYTVYVYNGCSSVTSASVDLTIKDSIAITSPPASLTKAPGQSATFSVTATGPGLRYQWRGKDGGNIPGATASSYTIPSVTANDAGSYYVVVYNGCGTVNSAAAMLTVSLANPANNARFDIQNVPTTMTAGQSYNIAIRMTNTGTSTWTKANGYKLLPQRPQGNSMWGVRSVDLPASLTQVSPNGVAIFNFAVTAPSTPGSYVFEWRMAQNGVGFGDFSPALPVTVTR
jgi:hypothetical protein